ncbi:hypothetical protein GE061_003125 [Apolygus lucorum]|uniref:Gustatory receptor n=1 Tax=Apolygus lucorum TaxID=248454 RepID=A0A6A4JTS9_APOLU|nr:hypothetical protein GE061_003125 [Apolygus lucorum]
MTTFFVHYAIQKFLTLVIPNVAAQQFYDELDNHYNKLFNIMKTNPVLCKKASLYLYVTTKHSVKLTVCGFFTLGYPLITSIIAGCATYLVVLIQFSS